MDLLFTPGDAAALLARRVRAARKRRGWTQAELARRAALSEPTVRRFESTGHGQLASLLQLASALGHLRDFQDVLAAPEPQSLDELREQG